MSNINHKFRIHLNIHIVYVRINQINKGFMQNRTITLAFLEWTLLQAWCEKLAIKKSAESQMIAPKLTWPEWLKIHVSILHFNLLTISCNHLRVDITLSLFESLWDPWALFQESKKSLEVKIIWCWSRNFSCQRYNLLPFQRFHRTKNTIEKDKKYLKRN